MWNRYMLKILNPSWDTVSVLSRQRGMLTEHLLPQNVCRELGSENPIIPAVIAVRQSWN